MTLVSIVTPVYNEVDNIRPFVQEVGLALAQTGCDWEIVFVADPCSDGTVELIRDLGSTDARVKLVELTRRFGQPTATLAGLDFANGDAVIVMDVDLQDPPTAAAEMIRVWQRGALLVLGQRSTRTGEPLVKKAVARSGYAFLSRFSEVPIPENTGDFRLMDRSVVRKVQMFPETHGFLRGLVALVGYEPEVVYFDRPARHSGHTKYNKWLGSLKIGFNGIVGFSTALLNMATLLGLVSAVYNYNRRSAALNDILMNVFNLVAFSFYDDKYGFETAETIVSAREAAERVHEWLGAKFDASKLQLSPAPTILGVTYNLKAMQLEIKADRKEELTEEIFDILQRGFLDPGQAGKLKGKLMFGASQLWGKVGRAFLRALSERQYSKFTGKDALELTPALRLSLEQWIRLVKEGPPRPIEKVEPAKSDVVLFTDGATPEDDRSGQEGGTIGAVVFTRTGSPPLQFFESVPMEVVSRWLPRKTQIAMIELVATVVALETFRPMLQNKTLLLFVDAEAVEGALVKGYSAREDLCELVGIFWNLVLELNCLVYVDRVPTDANPADYPSRGNLVVGKQLGWSTCKAVWPGSVVN